jgi:hypothetical protein
VIYLVLLLPPTLGYQLAFLPSRPKLIPHTEGAVDWHVFSAQTFNVVCRMQYSEIDEQSLKIPKRSDFDEKPIEHSLA